MEIVFCILFEKKGGTLLLKCNYDVKDLNLYLNGFYQELLIWWADFRNAFSDIKYVHYVIWNNKDLRNGNKPILYKKICRLWNCLFINDLLFNLDYVRSPECLKNKGLESHFLT